MAMSVYVITTVITFTSHPAVSVNKLYSRISLKKSKLKNGLTAELALRLTIIRGVI
jgi:hypothetical protein